jgi:uncharacterized protein (DUF1778 family)
MRFDLRAALPEIVPKAIEWAEVVSRDGKHVVVLNFHRCVLHVSIIYGRMPYMNQGAFMPATATSARLEARISFDLHASLKRAAELQGRTMTDFVVSAVQEAAQKAIEQAEVIRLSMADQQCFAQALLEPPAPAPAMVRAFSRRAKLLKPA